MTTKRIYCKILFAATVLLSLLLVTSCDVKNDSNTNIDYTISSGTYANGDMPFDDIPFINYKISVPSDWTAEKSGYWENEIYYTFHKDDSTNLYAGESYKRDYMDNTSLSSETDITTLEFGDFIATLRVIEYEDGYRYYFYIPVEKSYCCITGLSLEYSQEQQDEFFDITKTFKVVDEG